MESLIENALKKGDFPLDGNMSSDRIRISVVGVGGGGCNTIHRLTSIGIKSADTLAINTDRIHLNMIKADKKLLIGEKITKGLGAGGFPEVAVKCAESSKREIQEAISGTELMFLCAGMGGGTGTGASPTIAKMAKEQGTIVIAVVTYPFSLERARAEKAKWGIEELRKYADTVIVIDNNRLVSYVPNLPMNQAFLVADEITARAVKGIADTIMLPSLINIDFADVKTVMQGAGVAMISVGEGKGANKVEDAIQDTLAHPLLDVDYTDAKGALIHIIGGTQLTLGEANMIGEKLTESFDPNADVILGARLSPEYKDRIVVTAIITGITSPFITGRKEETPQLTPMEEVGSIRYL